MRSLLDDDYGRTIDYLRISITDRCNLRCIYCMPPEGMASLPRDELLSFEEITHIARLFMQMGGRRIRITGGEPLMRKGIVELIQRLSHIKPAPQLGLTTNGVKLATFARPLKQAGLTRVNISLDSLDPLRFAYLTLSSQWRDVLRGIEQAIVMNLKTKLNVVVLKGITDEEIIAFGKMAEEEPIEIRFIEFMPLCGSGWHPEWMLPIRHVKEVLQAHYELIPKPRAGEVAESYEIERGKGSIGFIASMTEPFCHTCSRLRLTADGKLMPCLFSHQDVDLKPLLRDGVPDQQIIDTIARAVTIKPRGHHVRPFEVDPKKMPRIRFIGG